SSMSCLSAYLTKAHTIVRTADDSYLENLSSTFVEMRMIGHKCTFNDLPNEVVSLIFLHCTPSQDQPARLTVPLLLLQVCSRWSAIAIGTAGLW
ncbi:hypothetical protein B0H11DRAFT_1613608, partial [Mycena galericulata]